MKPFSIKVDGGLSLLIFPDSEAHLDGHAVLTYSYSIFKRKTDSIPDQSESEKLQQPGKQSNPNYMGSIVFDNPINFLITFLTGSRN